MKGKIIILPAFAFAVTMLLLPMDSLAFRPMRPHKFDISMTVAAGYPVTSEDYFTRNYLYENYNYETVESMYEEHMGYVTASALYTLRFEYKPLKWLSAGMDMAFLQMEGDTWISRTRDNYTTKEGYVLYMMPSVRFYYFRTKLSTLSSAVSGGVGIYDGFDQRLHGEIQVYPISYTLGSRVYGKAELSVGTLLSFGFHFGIGCRF